MQRLSDLTDRLMPPCGPAATIEGELLRALNKIMYRWYNDGDYWYDGYGIETAGAAASFLDHFAAEDFSPALEASYGLREDEYDEALDKLAEKVVAYVESRGGNYSPNHFDMLDFTPKYAYMTDEDYDDE